MHACMYGWGKCEQQKGLDGTCGSGLTVTSLTANGSRRGEDKAKLSFCDGFFSPIASERGAD